ncbi:MAG: Bacterial type secretion system protein domain protein [Planctomycetota bacterium]|nr:Bacterial type secretion system protein domain protein [Planctomycetota bacterium]
MSPETVTALAAATAATGVIAIYQVLSDLFLRDRSRVSDRVDEEFLKKRKDQARKSPLFKNLGQVAAELSTDCEARPSLKQRFIAMVEQSGMDVTPGRVAAIAGLVAASLFAIGFVVRGNPIDAAAAAVVGAIIPVWVVKKRRDGRIEKLRSQLPEAFDLMARVVRAGQTFAQSLLAVADEFPQPISTEFAFCYEQQNLGLSPEVTLRDLSRRNGLIELKIFVLAVLVQQQTGGNLAELLIKLADVVRDRYKIRGTIKTLTAEGRMQGWILAALPPLMLLLLFLLNPGYAGVLFQHPNILLITFGIELVGALWIRKIVNFDY